MKTQIILFTAIVFTSSLAHAQKAVNLEQAIESALKNNSGLRSISMEVDIQEQHKRTATEIPKMQAMLMEGQINSVLNDNNLQITQTIPFPTVFTSQSKLSELKVQTSKYKKVSSENELIFQVKQLYQMARYLQSQYALLKRQDSLYAALVQSTALRYKTGDVTLLQKTTVEMRYSELENLLRQNLSDQISYANQLRILMNHPTEVTFPSQPLQPLQTTLTDDSTLIANNPQLAYQRSLNQSMLQEKRVELNRTLPDLTFGYFNQSLTGFQPQADGTDKYYSSGYRFNGFMVGVSVPIWFLPNLAKIKSTSLRAASSQLSADYFKKQLVGDWQKAVLQFNKQKNSLAYYTQSALPNARLIYQQSQVAFRAGDIGQTDYRLNIQQVLIIEEGYLQAMLQYNQSILTLEFLSGKYINH